jgi:hypothetical protein
MADGKFSFIKTFNDSFSISFPHLEDDNRHRATGEGVLSLIHFGCGLDA